jgi:predicted enzyme related to lactoylglutathione lyase
MSRPVVHFELPADDLERAQSFYREAFGWNVMPVPDVGYTLLGTATTADETGRPTAPGEINGGMFTRTDDLKQPVITIAVDDIDEALTKIEQCGGKTLRGRQSVGDMGFTAYFNDSEGTVVGLWQNAS